MAASIWDLIHLVQMLPFSFPVFYSECFRELKSVEKWYKL